MKSPPGNAGKKYNDWAVGTKKHSFSNKYTEQHMEQRAMAEQIVEYKGYEIRVSREESLGGWENLYYSIYRKSDGFCCVEDFTTGEDTIDEYVQYMKEHIDEEEQTPDPWGEKEDNK